MTEPRATMERFYKLFAAGKLADAIELFDPDCVTQSPDGPLSRDEYASVVEAFKTGFPDAHITIDRRIESGDDVVVLGHFYGTHTGAFEVPGGAVAASSRTLSLRYVEYFRVTDGRITDHQTLYDQVELLGQLGALPEP